MSSVPNGTSRPSSRCRRSATQAPPVTIPINPVWGATSGRICAASLPSSCSASGAADLATSCRRRARGVEIALQDFLRCCLVEQGLSPALRDSCFAQAEVGGGGGQPLVDELDRNAETGAEIARELTRQ